MRRTITRILARALSRTVQSIVTLSRTCLTRAQAPAGSHQALQAFSAVFRLLEVAEAERQPLEDYSGLSDEELEQAIRQRVGRGQVGL
jgi:hypothetical protein